MIDATLCKQKMLDKTKRIAIKLKDEETNVIQVFDVRGHKEIFDKTKRGGSQSDTSIKSCSITHKTIFVKTKRCAMK